MLKKIRLNQKQTYERFLAVKYMAEMVVNYIEGRAHSRRLGCEQGVPCWDDLIIESHDGVLEHVQIKRQETDFDDKPTDRGAIKAGKPQELSPLDKTIESLACHFDSSNSATSQIAHRFTLMLPREGGTIKKNLEIRHFSQLCSDCGDASATAAGLALRAGNDTTIKRLYEWLTTWCGFSDWSHILISLRNLTILTIGSENDINAITNGILASCFTTPDVVRKEILHILDDNSTDICEITPRWIFFKLRSYLLPQKTTWSQYHRASNASPWKVAGTHGQLEREIEPPDSVVSSLWMPSGPLRTLVVEAQCSEQNTSPLHPELMRLALHLQGSAHAQFHGVDSWKMDVAHAIGGTIGLSSFKLDCLPWTDLTYSLNPSDTREIRGNIPQMQEAECLTSSMDTTTWNMVCDLLATNIAKLTDPALKDAVESRWENWKQILAGDTQQRSDLLEKMLHPTAEGNDVLGSLRVGPMTVEILADGLQLLLIVSVALADGEVNWISIGNDREIRTIALQRWSGPSGQKRCRRRLTEEGILDLLGKETAQVLILSEVEASPSEIEDTSLADDQIHYDYFALQHRPMLLVTRSIKLLNLLSKGTLDSISEYFRKELLHREQAREKNINQFPLEATDGNC